MYFYCLEGFKFLTLFIFYKDKTHDVSVHDFWFKKSKINLIKNEDAKYIFLTVDSHLVKPSVHTKLCVQMLVPVLTCENIILNIHIAQW